MCFEPALSINVGTMVDNKFAQYNKTTVLPEFTKPGMQENVPALAVWVDENGDLRKAEFQCGFSTEYVPITGYKLQEVRLVAHHKHLNFVRSMFEFRTSRFKIFRLVV